MREIGADKPTFIIAEAGINHNGSLETAKDLIRMAAKSSADAVKFQLWNAERFHSNTEQIRRLNELDFADDEWRELKSVADSEGIPFFASVFDEERVDFLVEELDAPIVKIASGDLTHIPLLEHVARKDCPVIASTGMATLGEVERAVEALEPNNAPVYLLECVSSYPVNLSELNLSVVQTLARSFDCSVGLSDHTSGIIAPTSAVALGATVVEKHFTLDNDMDGPDHELSLEPNSFERMVEQIRAVESGLGDGRKRPRDVEKPALESMRRGLKTTCPIERGEPLTTEMVKITRPSTGIEPRQYDFVMGKVVQTSLEDNEPITWDDLVESTD